MLNKIRQVAAEVKSDDERLGKLEVWINTQKSLLTEDQSKTQGVIRKHRESMTQHRLKAYDSRARRGIYLGTARQS